MIWYRLFDAMSIVVLGLLVNFSLLWWIFRKPRSTIFCGRSVQIDKAIAVFRDPASPFPNTPALIRIPEDKTIEKCFRCAQFFVVFDPNEVVPMYTAWFCPYCSHHSGLETRNAYRQVPSRSGISQVEKGEPY